MFASSNFAAATAENDPSVVFALDASLRIAFCNPAWDRFASEKAGTAAVRASDVLGRPVLDFIAGPLRGFYEFAFKRVLTAGEPWKHEYECSSASLFRQFTMEVLPIRQPPGLMIINTLVVLRPHSEPPLPAINDLYWDKNRRIIMCCSCRKTMRQAG